MRRKKLMPKAAVETKLCKVCKAPVPDIHRAHNPKGRFLPKFPADRDESAMFRTVWPPVLNLILEVSLPSEAKEEMAVVVAVLPASAFMGLLSNSFFLYFIPSLFLSFLAGSVSVDTKLSKYLWISHAIHVKPRGKRVLHRSFLDNRISISFCWDDWLNPWITHLISLANGYPARPLALFPGRAIWIG